MFVSSANKVGREMWFVVLGRSLTAQIHKSDVLVI